MLKAIHLQRTSHAVRHTVNAVLWPLPVLYFQGIENIILLSDNARPNDSFLILNALAGVQMSVARPKSPILRIPRQLCKENDRVASEYLFSCTK